jgi:RNA polymerase primary sigma factor
LREVGRHPLLRHEEEIELAKAIEMGASASSRLERSAGTIDRNTSRELASRVEAGRRAKREFVQANLRLVVSIARRYQGFGLPLLDLIQDGNIGLLRAVEKFDWRRGFKFSTYATWWIRQGVSRGLADGSRVIRAPVHVVEALHSLRRTEEELASRLGREPTDAEVAGALDIEVGQLHDYRRMSHEPASLSAPIGDGEMEFHELIEDQTSESPLGAALRVAARDEMLAVLRTLGPRERRILELRFGFVDGLPKTLEEIGGELGLTRERIRQIEAKAIAKLRHPGRGPQVRELAD